MIGYRKYLKCFWVGQDAVGKITFNDAFLSFTRDYNFITLKKITTPIGRVEYDLDPHVFFTQPEVVPKVTRWLLLQVDVDVPADTLIRARAWDGTDERWWDGSAWVAVVDTVNDWNTFQEISDNLQDWNVVLPLGFSIELSTTDRQVTPAFRAYRLMYEVQELSQEDSWLYETIIQGMIDDITCYTDYVFDVPALSTATDTVSFDESDYTVKWPDATPVGVWLVSDTRKASNLFLSYGAGVITLTEDTTPGVDLLIRFSYKPVIAHTTSQDYDEVAACPSVVITSFNRVWKGESQNKNYIMNVFTDPPEATIFPESSREDVLVVLDISAPQASDLLRLQSQVMTWLRGKRLLTNGVTGDTCTLEITQAPQDSTVMNMSEVHSSSLAFSLRNVYFSDLEAFDSGSNVDGAEFAYGVSSINFDIQTKTSTSIIVSED